MKKTNKLILGGLTAFAAVAAPIATVVSCGKKSDYANKVVIKTTFSSAGPQMKGLKTVVDKYNAQRGNKLEVVIQHVEGGYGTIMPKEIKDIRNKNMNPVANLIIDYPDSIGQLVSYGRQLDFGSLGLKRDSFEKDFVAANDQIAHVKSGGLYAVPLAKSTEMVTYDMPVLSHMFAELKAAGATIDSTAGVPKRVADWENNSSVAEKTSDAAAIKNLWTPKSGAKTTMTINEKTFTSYSSLFKFAEEVQNFYGKKAKDGTEHVIGHDAPANLVYQMSFGKLGYDQAQFLFSKNGDKFDYKYLDAASAQGKALKEVINVIRPAVANGGLVLNGGGAYSSEDLKKHHMAIAIGSTAGYHHNFVKGKTEATTKTGSKIELDSYTKEFEKTTKTGAIAQTTDGYHNPVYPSTYTGTVGSHDIKLSSPAADKVIKDAVANGHAYGTSTQGAADIKGAEKGYMKAGKFQYYVVPGSSVSKSGTNPGALNENEARFGVSPAHFAAADKKGTYMSQGPSFIGIKHGNKRDQGAADFMKWFFDTNSKIGKQGETAVQVFDKLASYITPVAGAFSGKSQYKEGNAIAFKAFKEISSNPEFFAFDSPVDTFTGKLRKNAFDAVLKAQFSDFAHSNDSTKSSDDIYKKIVEASKREMNV